jgi:hypothetical protein
MKSKIDHKPFSFHTNFRGFNLEQRDAGGGLTGSLCNDLPQGHPGWRRNWPRAEEAEAARLG